VLRCTTHRGSDASRAMVRPPSEPQCAEYPEMDRPFPRPSGGSRPLGIPESHHSKVIMRDLIPLMTAWGLLNGCHGCTKGCLCGHGVGRLGPTLLTEHDGAGLAEPDPLY
jgi:hypothetical protein